MKSSLFLAAPAFFLVLAGTGMAAEHEVKMLNKGEAGTMVFEPAYVQAEPGDVVRFVPTDKSHNVEGIKGMLPEGVENFKSKINEEYSLTVDAAGLYGVKCTPHLAMGMVALIQVGGDQANIDAIKTGKLPKKARSRMDDALAKMQ
ncbi:MAG: pseudoazurin [Pseudorhodobacter sp.]